MNVGKTTFVRSIPILIWDIKWVITDPWDSIKLSSSAKSSYNATKNEKITSYDSDRSECQRFSSSGKTPTQLRRVPQRCNLPS